MGRHNQSFNKHLATSMYRNGFELKDIASCCDTSITAIQTFATNNHIERDPTPILARIIKQLATEGKGVDEIARLIERSPKTVRDYASRYEIDALRIKRPVDRETFERLVMEGKSTQEIGEAIGRSKASVNRLFKRFDIDKPIGRSAIPDTDVDRVRELVRQGYLEREIGDLYGFSQKNVSKFMIKHDLQANNGRGRPRGQ